MIKHSSVNCGEVTLDRKQPAVLVLVFGDISRDSRVLRQIHFLKEKYHVIAAGHGNPNIEGIEYVGLTTDQAPRIPRFPKLAQRIVNRCWHIVRQGLYGLEMYGSYDASEYRLIKTNRDLAGLSASVIIANDIECLPLAVKLSTRAGAAIVCDAHEWGPGEFDGDPKWIRKRGAHCDHLCRRYLPMTCGMVTVCHGIADLYQQHYGQTCVVVTNAPPYQSLEPKQVGETIRLIYQGGVSKDRNSENLLKLMDLLDERYTLTLMVSGSADYLSSFREAAKKYSRISFRPFVPLEEVPKIINDYDIGLYPLFPGGTNTRLALPNKFFEFIQARLAIAIWPSLEMKRILETHYLGVVADEFELSSLATKLNSLCPSDIMRFKQNSHRAAEELCAEKNQKIFLDAVEQAIVRKEGG